MSVESRPWRRELRPVAWAVLEDVALDGVLEDGDVLARTSARMVADHVGIDASTAVRALAGLRRQGLLRLRREPGAGGRFGLSVYVVSEMPGLVIGCPCAQWPHTVEPCVVDPRRDGARLSGPRGRVAPAPGRTAVAGDQAALDLGLGDA